MIGCPKFLKTNLYKSAFALHIPAPMTLLGINLLNVSITALVVIYVFVCLLMILLVLMQRPKQEGLGAAFGANTTDQLFGARTTNVLQKGTVYMAVLFFVLTLTLAILIQKKNAVTSLTKSTAEAAATEQKVDEEPAKSLTEELPVSTTSAPESTVPAEAHPATEAPAPSTPAEGTDGPDKTPPQ